MISASKAGPDQIVRKFLSNDQTPATKHAYQIRITPCVEYDAKGNIVGDDKSQSMEISGTIEEENLKALLGLLGESIKLAKYI